MHAEKDTQFVYFGAFLQDDEKPMPIRWRVHSIADDRVALLCDVVLFAAAFDPKSAVYETSALRRYLNGAFLQTAFSEEERAQMVATDLGGFCDKVYLPTRQEVERYAQKDRIRAVTKFARKRGASADETEDEEGGILCENAGWYWTRTMAQSHVSDNHRFAENVTPDGEIEHTCIWAEDIGVVPMITVKRK